jgi:hypothetical protein
MLNSINRYQDMYRMRRLRQTLASLISMLAHPRTLRGQQTIIIYTIHLHVRILEVEICMAVAVVAVRDLVAIAEAAVVGCQQHWKG